MADPITWYALGRIVDDPESIMEAIDAKILTHNLDPSAHGQTNEAVYEHRLATALDHTLASIDARYQNDKKVSISSSFESLDGWELVGAEVGGIISQRIETNGAINDVASLVIVDPAAEYFMDPSKNPYFQTTVQFPTITNQEAHIVCGSIPGLAANATFGFKIVNGDTYAYWISASTEYTQLLSGIDINLTNVYRAYINYTAGEMYFYINGVLKHTATTNLPTTVNDVFFGYRIKATSASVRGIVMRDFHFEQDR